MSARKVYNNFCSSALHVKNIGLEMQYGSSHTITFFLTSRTYTVIKITLNYVPYSLFPHKYFHVR